ncbi:hypothetical protein [Pseudomonas sp. PLMAX]|jgi:hypothetical protein|uniref:hypothetical protein n=1 Tax=Pseudomonas sp. PLMAX TaxID=2201998 RepID=UPI0038B9ACD6
MLPDNHPSFTAFDHTPVRPARDGCIGEQIYLKNWISLITEDNGYHPDYDGPNGLLRSIVDPADGIITQRHATVAASMLRWLGTNNGRGLLQKAEHFAQKLGNRPDGFVAAWAIECRRSNSVNSGLNGPDHVMMPAGSRIPEKLSADDLEVMASIMEWISADTVTRVCNGGSFLRKCEADVLEAVRAENRRVRSAREETTLSGPGR